MQKRIFTKEEINLMIKMYKEGETYAQIAKLLGTKQSKVSEKLKELGYPRRPLNTLKNKDYLSKSRKHHFNEDYFEEINSEEKAYWLGFLYADGYVCLKKDKNGNNKGGAIELSLKKSDEGHMKKFLSAISGDHEIKYRKIKLNGNIYDSCRVCVHSVKMVNDLIKLGCTQAKSLTLKPPKLVPNEYIKDFIRGYFDGDGSIGSTGRNGVSILGTEEFLDFIRSFSGIPHVKIKSFEHKKCFELSINKIKDKYKFLNYIYSNSTIYLDRKYELAIKVINHTKNRLELKGEQINERKYTY